MRIERVTLLTVEIPLLFPFETSFGRWTHRRALLVVVEGGGLIGYGEVTAHETPVFSYETLETAREVIRSYLAPAIARRDVKKAEDLSDLLAFVRGHPMAKAGVEGAVLDLLARSREESLASAIGGTKERVPGGVSLGIEPSVEVLVERARPFVERRAHRIKVKIRPGWDRRPLETLRREFPALALAADANGAYRLQHADHLASLDDLGLLMLEQPLAWDDLVDHADLGRRIRTPICLDESISSPAAARAAIALGSGRIFNVKLGRVGGMSASLTIHDQSMAAGIPLWCGGMLETCIGRLHNIALASLPGFVMPGDLWGSDRYFALDLVSPPIRVGPDGTLAVPDGPGIGREVDLDALRSVTRHEEVLVGEAGV